jgi:hypothetical protein
MVMVRTFRRVAFPIIPYGDVARLVKSASCSTERRFSSRMSRKRVVYVYMHVSAVGDFSSPEPNRKGKPRKRWAAAARSFHHLLYLT